AGRPSSIGLGGLFARPSVREADVTERRRGDRHAVAPRGVRCGIAHHPQHVVQGYLARDGDLCPDRNRSIRLVWLPLLAAAGLLSLCHFSELIPLVNSASCLIYFSSTRLAAKRAFILENQWL